MQQKREREKNEFYAPILNKFRGGKKGRPKPGMRKWKVRYNKVGKNRRWVYRFAVGENANAATNEPTDRPTNTAAYSFLRTRSLKMNNRIINWVERSQELWMRKMEQLFLSLMNSFLFLVTISLAPLFAYFYGSLGNLNPNLHGENQFFCDFRLSLVLLFSL